ncbi:MAG: GNAT family N-acetyltransferase [Alphaproteobacteria bacterium]|nr:GNAT family N-acetyltransferase [Alphaproteobacteria bacterium]
MTILKIKDLTLRPIELADAPRFAELCNDETLARNTSRIPFPYTLEDATNFVNRAIREFDDGAEYRRSAGRRSSSPARAS